jgi:hypothetical protein
VTAARSVEGSGAVAGGLMNDAGAFSGGDGAMSCAEAVVEEVAQVLGGTGGMQVLAVVWCHPWIEGEVDGVVIEVGATTCGSAFAFSLASQAFMKASRACVGVSEGVAPAVVDGVS